MPRKTAEISAKENLMIGSAQQKGSTVYVYNERGNLLFTKNGELQGFTATTVTIRSGHTLYTYNDRGNLNFSKSV